jgi:hypothetical protein
MKENANFSQKARGGKQFGQMLGGKEISQKF